VEQQDLSTLQQTCLFKMTKLQFDKNDFSNRLDKAKWAIAIRLQESMKSKLTPNWGWKTGDLKSSIRANVVGNTIEISMLERAKFIEFGTPPHIIKVKNKKVLSDGKRIFGTKVNHPGTHPFPFIRNTFHKEFTKIVKEELSKAFN